MRTILVMSLGKRPLRPTSLTLLTLTLVGAAANTSWQIAQSEIGRVVLLLVRLGFKLIPLTLWIGGVLIVALWLVVMVRVWRS